MGQTEIEDKNASRRSTVEKYLRHGEVCRNGELKVPVLRKVKIWRQTLVRCRRPALRAAESRPSERVFKRSNIGNPIVPDSVRQLQVCMNLVFVLVHLNEELDRHYAPLDLENI